MRGASGGRELVNGLLLVHAHPDDECFATAGLIARSVAEGRQVDLVTCTGGEEGEIHDPTLDEAVAKPRLREIREGELQCSLDALRGNGPGTLELHLLGYRDSGMMGTESNQRPDAFWNVDLDEATGKLVEIVRRVRPAVMVSYDANGNYGHPDHINAYRIAAAAWDAAADPARFPQAGSPHGVGKLYEIAFNRDRWTALMSDMRERGIEMPWGSNGDEETADTAETPQADSESETGEEQEWGVPEADLTTILDVSAWYEQKRASMDCHKTQRQDMGWLLDMPQDLAQRAASPEHFVLTRWRDREVPVGYRETSVWEGLGPAAD
jgi:N-acetyl-1-D-myo-inositol-2-amino-2-deoxy-alpha-D-glucopyranoside deacetylase